MQGKINVAIEKLVSVLCDPEGRCCIQGSDADRKIVDEAIAELKAAVAPEKDVEHYKTVD